ncbi:hypothetical protein [Streptomyces sp. NPDC089799]|uniref:hypothetical protein n=1 Tax=Streptomyces sp. NPDC089799 TaxID=3155066 RepID=UPI00342524BE
MRRRHHFHTDHLGHSVSATVQTGHTVVVEVLVDGKETGYATTRKDVPVTVTIELPTDPPTSASVLAAAGPDGPHVTFTAPDAEPRPMPPRPY